jgi:pre-mRNA-splicing helicase BRR2
MSTWLTKLARVDDIRAGDNVTVQVTLERDMTNLPSEVGPVHAPRYPKPKEEGWWLVIGDSSTNQGCTSEEGSSEA